MRELTIAYSPEYLNWEGSHATPQRARLAVEHLRARAETSPAYVLDGVIPQFQSTVIRPALEEIHDAHYVAQLLAGLNQDHPGVLQGRTAALMFEGTRLLTEDIIARDYAPQVWFNPQGAKHHAQYAEASGFCAFNDMAWAAQRFNLLGKRVAYLDWDAHHGDGVENLTRDFPHTLTASIHQRNIFPGTGTRHDVSHQVWNYPLHQGDGNDALLDAVFEALVEIERFSPDVLLLAIGADGHDEDPLAGLTYTLDGFIEAAAMVRDYLDQTQIPVLVGGAGGYTPLTYTPIVWAEVVRTLTGWE